MEKSLSLHDIQDENISPATWVLGFAFAITLIVFIQQLITDLTSLLNATLPQNIINNISSNTAAAVASVVVTVPLAILAVLIYIAQRDTPLRNPYKFASFASLLAMGINTILMLLTILSFLNDVNPTITTYLVSIILMALLVLGMVKVQENTKKETEVITVTSKKKTIQEAVEEE